MLLAMALAAPAFGGRMIDSGGLPATPSAREPDSAADAAEPADAGMVGEAENEPAKDPDMEPERAEDADADLTAAPTPTAPAPRWRFSQSYSFSASYDDNIYIGSLQKVGDEIFQLGANFRLIWGDYLDKKESFLSIHYAPSYLVFADHRNQNGFEQTGELAGQWRIAKLTLGAQAHVVSLSGADADVGQRTNRTNYDLALSAKYDYGEKTSIETDLGRSASDYRAYLSSTEWVNQNWIDYQLFPKTKIGAGLTLGYLEPQSGDTQTYQQALVRFATPLRAKLSATGSGGIEFRQFGGAAGAQIQPIFRLGVNYLPFDGTQIGVDASRVTYSSAAQVGQNYTATGVSVSVRQRLFQRFSASIAGGYESTKYEGTDAASATSRHDEYLFLRPAVSFAVMKRLNLELYYQFRRNTSTLALSSFDDNVFGLQATVGF